MMNKIKRLVFVFVLIAGLLGLNACTRYIQQSVFLYRLQKQMKNELIVKEEERIEIGSQHEDDFKIHLEKEILNPSSLEVLVNKQYDLDEDYEPDDLVTVDVPTATKDLEGKKLRAEAASKLKDMFNEAEESGIILYARSGYRSYKTQAQLYDNYASIHSEEAANLFSARPGESEHQTGLAMDVTSASVNYQLTESFGKTKEGIWLRDNAHRYGFVIRYPHGSEDITGYLYEPWHLRYLGKKLATEIFENNLPYKADLLKRGVDIETNQ